VGDSDDASFGDFIEDKAAESPLDMTSFSLLKGQAGATLLCSLNERERKVLELRFGLGDGQCADARRSPASNSGSRASASGRSRPRRFAKLRHPTRLRHLQGFLEVEGLEMEPDKRKITG